jgi:hypothetical protein
MAGLFLCQIMLQTAFLSRKILFKHMGKEIQKPFADSRRYMLLAFSAA